MKKLPFILYLLFVAFVVFIPLNVTGLSEANKVYVLNFRLDYLIHILLFLPWIFIGEISFSKEVRYYRLIIFASGIFVASMAELLHYYTPYRAFNINDLTYNVAGIILGSVVWLFFRRKSSSASVKDNG